jgi:sulfate adenylyltransferase subunit 1
MDILKIATAGSVDDGKSTLIGRLLYDTKSIAKDKLEAIENTSKRKGLDFVDLSLLTDGLIAEREQGITIDVAHIYFGTANRKYIIADTPGHVEYTRNMITGASTAQAAIVLIDARNGIWEQTRRHLCIFALMKIKNIMVCINKMDMVAYHENVFAEIKNAVEEVKHKINIESNITYFPISAKYGDNVVQQSNNMPWYKGQTLLQALEKITLHENDLSQKATLPIQLVIRPHADAIHDFRGYAGKVFSGVFKVGDAVKILPSLKETTIKSIQKGEKQINVANAEESVLVQLADDIDVSRGNMIVHTNSNFELAQNFDATIAWLDETALSNSKSYILQHAHNRVKTKIQNVNSLIDIESLNDVKTDLSVQLNDIAKLTLKTAKPIFADSYNSNAANAVFILIDEQSNNTVAVGFVA